MQTIQGLYRGRLLCRGKAVLEAPLVATMVEMVGSPVVVVGEEVTDREGATEEEEQTGTCW